MFEVGITLFIHLVGIFSFVLCVPKQQERAAHQNGSVEARLRGGHYGASLQ